MLLLLDNREKMLDVVGPLSPPDLVEAEGETTSLEQFVDKVAATGTPYARHPHVQRL